jgi:hypothetical protein
MSAVIAGSYFTRYGKTRKITTMTAAVTRPMISNGSPTVCARCGKPHYGDCDCKTARQLHDRSLLAHIKAAFGGNGVAAALRARNGNGKGEGK